MKLQLLKARDLKTFCVSVKEINMSSRLLGNITAGPANTKQKSSVGQAVQILWSTEFLQILSTEVQSPQREGFSWLRLSAPDGIIKYLNLTQWGVA